MLRDIALIHLILRLLTFAFFLSLSLGMSLQDKALLIVPASVYALLGIYNFLYPGRLKIFIKFGDFFFVPLLVLLSKQSTSLMAFLPFIAFYTTRKIFNGILFLWFLAGLSFYYHGKTALLLLPAFLSLYVASLHPDLVEAIRKERFYIKNLRKNYKRLIAEYSRLEKEIYDLKHSYMLLEKLQKSVNLEDYLKSVKEEFNLKAIRILPLSDPFTKAKVDINSFSFQVPVNLEKGKALVVFYMNNPLELYDEKLLKSLEMAGNLINLYIEGFDERAKFKEIAL